MEKNTTSILLSQFEKYVDDETEFYFKVVVYICAVGVTSSVGVVANAINVVVFSRQGAFSDSSTVTLLCLAVSDFWCTLTALWLSIGFAVSMADPPGLAWEPYDILVLPGGWPHLMCAQMTRMLTAYVALERCLCVVFPFKVRLWFKPARSLGINIAMFSYCLITYFPLFVSQKFDFSVDPATNETRLVTFFTENRQLIIFVTFYFSAVANLGSVALVLLCTTITISRVKLSKSWRETMSKLTKPGDEATLKDSTESKSGKNPKGSSDGKEARMIKMVTSISLITLICYIPDVSMFLAYVIKSDIRVLGPYDNLANVMYSLTFLMETINSTINIIVYYRMSTRFRKEFDKLFKKGKC